jgi:hypothetical protein
MDCVTPSNMHAWWCARPPALVLEGLIERASATTCNWRSLVSPIRNPGTRSGVTALAWTWGLRPLPLSPVRALHARELLCADLAPDAQAIRRLQRQMERQRRANNPDNFDARGRIKKGGKGRLSWKHSKRYLVTRRRKATRERRLAAHRKSLHGRLVHEIVAVGKTVITEHVSYRARPQQFGRSVGLRAPGMFIALLRRTVARTGGTQGARSHTQHQTVTILPWRHESMFPSRCGSAGTSVPVASQPSATSTPHFWLLISNHQTFFPRVPNRGTPPVGKVGNPACAHAYEQACQRASARQPPPRSVTYARRPSASASKSKPSDTRARLPSQATGNVEAKQGTSAA